MDTLRLAILSDVHYASDAEKARRRYYSECVKNPLLRGALELYRHYYWHRDPFAHNHLLDRFIQEAPPADLVVAVGDYSCDSGFTGVADQAAFESAQECLCKLRAAYQDKFLAIIGDHEFGKKPLGANVGGPRVASYWRATKELGLEPFWVRKFGRYVLIGVTSCLIAWPVFIREALEAEVPEWQKLRDQHLQLVRQAFQNLEPGQRVLLFCHDPTALPYLWEEAVVREKIGQLDATIIGHLHSRWFLFKSRLLAGMPTIQFLGHTVTRLSAALRKARYWRPFKLMLCPSLFGMQLLKDGGYCTAELRLDGKQPAEFHLHRWHK